MLAGVTGAIVSSVTAGPTFFCSPLEMSLEGDGLACGGMEKSWPDKPALARFAMMVVGVEVADFVARFRTTVETMDDLRFEAGLFEESSSLGEALRLPETMGAGVCWV